jgi:hypothetical protein
LPSVHQDKKENDDRRPGIDNHRSRGNEEGRLNEQNPASRKDRYRKSQGSVNRFSGDKEAQPPGNRQQPETESQNRFQVEWA